MADLQGQIEELWEHRSEVEPGDKAAARLVREAVDLLDTGQARVAEVVAGRVVVHAWLKQAILLLFRLSKMKTSSSVRSSTPTRCRSRAASRSWACGSSRAPPRATGRSSNGASCSMPSYVNIGAHVGHNTMVDTWATVGSCAQIGANVHLSGGVGIGGVLEPPQAAPVIVEDDCLIGSRCIVAEGARVGRDSVLGAGCILTGSIPVIDAQTGAEVGRGNVPAHSVAVTATRPRKFGSHEFGLPCILVIKHLHEGERHDKGQLESILRDHGATV